MRYVRKHHLALATLLIAGISGSYVSAEQTDFKLTIEPLACVIDITSLGSIANSSIAPKECEKVIDTPPPLDLTPTTANEQRPTIVYTALDDPITGNPLQIPSPQNIVQLSTNDFTASNQASGNLTLSSAIGMIIATTAIIAAGAIASTVVLGTTTAQTITGSIAQNFQKIRSWFK